MAPPRGLLRVAWTVHRTLFAVSGGRIGIRRAQEAKLGSLRLRTVGRRSGEPRQTFLSFVDDGPNIAVVASNGGADVDPAWYLNLRASPDTSVELAGERRAVRARDADPEERARIYPRFVAGQSDYAEYERRTSRPIPVVILERR